MVAFNNLISLDTPTATAASPLARAASSDKLIFERERVPSLFAITIAFPDPEIFGMVTSVVLVPRAIWFERVVEALEPIAVEFE